MLCCLLLGVLSRSHGINRNTPGIMVSMHIMQMTLCKINYVINVMKIYFQVGKSYAYSLLSLLQNLNIKILKHISIIRYFNSNPDC